MPPKIQPKPKRSELYYRLHMLSNINDDCHQTIENIKQNSQLLNIKKASINSIWPRRRGGAARRRAAKLEPKRLPTFYAISQYTQTSRLAVRVLRYRCESRPSPATGGAMPRSRCHPAPREPASVPSRGGPPRAATHAGRPPARFACI